LVRDGAAVLVTGADDVLELATPLTEVGVAPDDAEAEDGEGPLRVDFGSLGERKMFDVLTRRDKAIEAAAAAAGLSLDEARAALGALETVGLAERHRSGWRRIAAPTRGRKAR
jgi:predicted Rossmann fold nucleotide-binding protein DprA/Smf involved in DNA uptake